MGNSNSLKVPKEISIEKESNVSSSTEYSKGHGQGNEVHGQCDCDICNLFEEIYFSGEGEFYLISLYIVNYILYS